jgi:hypothetical protein
MTLLPQLEGKTVDERAILKAQFFATEKEGIIVDKELAITVSNLRYEKTSFCADLAVSKDGQAIPLNNPFYFYNPPIMVPDGTFHTELRLDGTEMQVPNYKESPTEAMQVFISQVVRKHIYG